MTLQSLTTEQVSIINKARELNREYNKLTKDGPRADQLLNRMDEMVSQIIEFPCVMHIANSKGLAGYKLRLLAWRLIEK